VAGVKGFLLRPLLAATVTRLLWLRFLRFLLTFLIIVLIDGEVTPIWIPGDVKIVVHIQGHFATSTSKTTVPR
jgi:hypothetical protein